MKKRILVVLPCISKANGVSSYALNYYKKLDPQKIHMDFLVMKESENDCFSSFLENDTQIFELIKGNDSFVKYLKRIDDFFYKNASNYDIVHCHVYNSGAFILHVAKKYGVKNRILHSHATVSSDKVINRIINSFLIPIARKNATHYFACSDLAGKFLFKNSKFTVINNAINIEQYKFNLSERKRIRKELNIENDFVIGNIGRLCKQKNQLFLFKVFLELNKDNINSKLLIIGNGVLEKKLKEFVIKNNMCEKVLFLGARNDVEKMYNAMDVFCLPSLYEGLPVVGVEAQCNGLPCVFSDSITKEVRINDNVIFIDLKDEISNWKNAILKNKMRESLSVEKNKFDINIECKKLEEIYLEM